MSVARSLCAGGICPGVNSVIEGMVKRLADYGVQEVSKSRVLPMSSI